MNPRPASAAFDENVRDQRLQPQFRIIAVRGERKAFRLERVFWQAMEAIARRNRRALSEEIAVTLAQVSPSINQSAHLRARCASDLLDLWELAESRNVTPTWRRVVEAMPGAAFAMTRSQLLLCLNGSMREHLRRKGVPLADDAGERSMKLELAPAVIVQLRDSSGEPVECNMVFGVGAHRCVCRVRLVASNTAAEPLVIGFVISHG